MTSAERREAVPLDNFPWPDADATPVVLADEGRCALGYQAAADGAPTVILFPRCEAYRVGPASGPAGVYEIRDSPWPAEVDRSQGANPRHLVFGFRERTFECAVPRWDVVRKAGDDLVATMRALLRHDTAPVLHLEDTARGRLLPTTLYLPEAEPAPLVVFAHGWFGHPRKFARLFRGWMEAGFAVAAPAFPRTNDESVHRLDMEDVVNQSADVTFVIDELLARGIGDPERIAVGGFSLGGETALAVALHPRYADPRVRAVAAVAGCLHHADFATSELRRLPLLLVHGTEDQSVVYSEALAVHEAAHEPKELVTLEGAGHAICQDNDDPGHAARVAELLSAFFDRHLR